MIFYKLRKKKGSSFPFYFYFSLNTMITDIHNNPIRDSIVRDGYVVIDGLVPNESFQNLTEACDRTVAKARAGEWQHRRLVGTQFPPWKEGTDVWGVQHLMHPDLNEPEFAKWYGNNLLQEAVCELLGAKKEDLQLGNHIYIYILLLHNE